MSVRLVHLCLNRVLLKVARVRPFLGSNPMKILVNGVQVLAVTSNYGWAEFTAKISQVR
jgi:hypothetical protein